MRHIHETLVITGFGRNSVKTGAARNAAYLNAALSAAGAAVINEGGKKMPITSQEIKEHQDKYGIGDLGTMPTNVYRQLLDEGAFFWIDHHDHVRSTFSEEVMATNREQVDALIQRLQEFRERMPAPPDFMSEK